MNLSEQGFKVAVVIGHDKKEDGAFTGILNCRVNGEHKHIRF